MRLPEFIEAVESYGIRISGNITKAHGFGVDRDYWESILGPMPMVGAGRQREYTPRMVRRLVAWLMIGSITGSAWNRSAQRRQACRLLAAASEGYIIMAEGRAWWSLVPPLGTMRTGCCVVVPVPEWRHKTPATGDRCKGEGPSCEGPFSLG